MTDYRAELRKLYFSFTRRSRDSVADGLKFYDWNCDIEQTYRKFKNLKHTDRITDKAVYEFAINVLNIKENKIS